MVFLLSLPACCPGGRIGPWKQQRVPELPDSLWFSAYAYIWANRSISLSFQSQNSESLGFPDIGLYNTTSVIFGRFATTSTVISLMFSSLNKVKFKKIMCGFKIPPPPFGPWVYLKRRMPVKWVCSANYISISSAFLRARLSEHMVRNHLGGADWEDGPWGGCGVQHSNELQGDSHAE